MGFSFKRHESHAPPARSWLGSVVGMLLLVSGCTPLSEWVHNGFKVGPNYHEPTAPVAHDWIEQTNPYVISQPLENCAWWTVFGDPVLDSLISKAYQENLDLKTAGTRVLEALAQRNVAAGNLFPQTQQAIGAYIHGQLPQNLNLFNSPVGMSLPNTINVWATGFNASWELDFWGRFRRQVESSNAELSASVESYHDALVTLLADVATNYVQIRTYQQRILFARQNVLAQQGSLRLAEARLKAGVRATALDVHQARSNLAQTEASIPPLVIGMQQAADRLCILLGQPPCNLLRELGEGPVPIAPPQVAVGIPADLLERRPDVRRALREAAAQSAQIGVAEADFYPSIGVTGFLGYAADDIRHLFAEKSFVGIILPNFQWKLLNYGRILNNVRTQEARLKERVYTYQQTVLTAAREVEDALVAFLQSQLQALRLEESVRESQASVELVLQQYQAGTTDFNRVYTTQSTLATQQDQLANVRGTIALNLLTVYRALGGGWQYFDDAAKTKNCESALMSRPAQCDNTPEGLQPAPQAQKR